MKIETFFIPIITIPNKTRTNYGVGDDFLQKEHVAVLFKYGNFSKSKPEKFAGIVSPQHI